MKIKLPKRALETLHSLEEEMEFVSAKYDRSFGGHVSVRLKDHNGSIADISILLLLPKQVKGINKLRQEMSRR